MKIWKNRLDEMQEQKMLQIEHNACWLAFWGLLAGEETEMENMSHVIQVIQGGIGAVLSVYGICLWFRNRGKRTLAVSCILSGAVLLGYAVFQSI